MIDPDSLPKNFDEARVYYESLSPEDSVVKHIAKDALIKQLLARNRQAEHDKFHDGLTGLRNRAGIIDFFDLRRGHFRRATDPTRTDLMLMLDLDKFKDINDTHGHDVGDKTLVGIARALELSLRQGDAVARLGGDEFLAILLAANIDEGKRVVERIGTNADALAHADGSLIIPPMSAGLAPIDYLQEFTDNLRFADQAMYLAKRAGGNQVQFIQPGVIELPE